MIEDLNDPIDPAEVARNKRAYDLERDALRAVLNTRNGRRFIWSQMGKCGLGKNPWTPQREATDFNCGRVSVAADLLVDMEAVNGDAYALMIREAREDQEYVNGSDPTQSDTGHDYDPTA